MTPLDENDIKARFMGTITASVTHEIQNVLAIIKENSGLMEDILLMSQDDSLSGMNEKFSACIEKIKKQAYRGVALTSGLNSFAHGPDHKILSVNVVESIKKLTIVCERIFKLKNIDIQISEAESLPLIETDPVLFQQIVFSSMKCLADTIKTSPLRIDFQHAGNQVTVNIFAENADIDPQAASSLITRTDEWQKIIFFSQNPAVNVTLLPETIGITICFSTAAS